MNHVDGGRTREKAGKLRGLDFCPETDFASVGRRQVHIGQNSSRREVRSHNAHPLSRSRRPFWRCQSRFFSVSRLSWIFLPRASASSTLAMPRTLKYIFSGTSVMLCLWIAPSRRAISRARSRSLRGRVGACPLREACAYSLI